jgi:thioredoxin-related protein
MKNSFLGIFFVFISLNIHAQTADKKPQIEWISLSEAYNRTQKEPRKTIVDVYTVWCGWCKVMDKNTYTNPTVIEYLNKNFYMVKFDAESHQDITIGTNKYTFDVQSRSHQAAVALLQGKMSYPTTVFLDEKYNLIQPLPGYLDAKAFHQIVTYIGGNYNTKESFDAYKTGTYPQTYQSSISKL